MPRFLIVESLPVANDSDLDPKASALFKPMPPSPVAANDSKVTAADGKACDVKAAAVEADAKELVVNWNTNGCGGKEQRVLSDPATLYELLYLGAPVKKMTGLSAYQIEAKDELDAYYQLVIKNRHFDLEQFITACQKQPTRFQGHTPNPPSITHYCMPQRALTWSFVKHQEKSAQKIIMETHPLVISHSWITPQIAKEMFLIYNDPRRLTISDENYGSAIGFNNAEPLKDLHRVRLIALDAVPLQTL